jgi:hypothetical protein
VDKSGLGVVAHACNSSYLRVQLLLQVEVGGSWSEAAWAKAQDAF